MADRPWFSPDEVVKPDDHWLHPMRYPKHPDELKGQVYSGECNTTHCKMFPAVCWNQVTYALYCIRCCYGHNWQYLKPKLTVVVDEKPNKELADKMYIDMTEAMIAAGGF